MVHLWMTYTCNIPKLVGGSNHLEKYESQWEGLSHIFWKIKHVPNHQPGKKSGSMIKIRKTILRRIHFFYFEAG